MDMTADKTWHRRIGWGARLALGFACSGCGGVMDSMTRPIEVQGHVTGPIDQALVIASPESGRTEKKCAERIAQGSLEECAARKIAPESDGTFQASIPGFMRACPFLVIPPLLDAFCDDTSYLLVVVPSQPAQVFSIRIDSGKAKVSRVVGGGDPSALTVTSVAEVPNQHDPRVLETKSKDSIDLAIRIGEGIVDLTAREPTEKIRP